MKMNLERTKTQKLIINATCEADDWVESFHQPNEGLNFYYWLLFRLNYQMAPEAPKIVK